jgi:hypothetical protein
MSNPTTPFSWQMPENTDLVTNLPADFEVFGQAVATSMADLLGGTTGQILSKATNADMDFAWIANDQGDITGVTATTPLTGGGTSGAITVGIQDASTTQKGSVQLSDSTSTTSSVLAATPTAVKSSYDLAAAAVPKSTVTTAGDVIYATGSSAVTRLGIGTAGQVLTVNGGATAPSWATPASGGGMTLLSTTSLSGSSVTISSISGSYTNLFVYGKDIYIGSGTDDLRFRFNGDTASNYTNLYFDFAGSALGGYVATSNMILGTALRTSTTWSNKGTFEMNIIKYTDTSNIAYSEIGQGYTGTALVGQQVWGKYNASAAVSSITVFSNSGATFAGGTVYVYGVK